MSKFGEKLIAAANDVRRSIKAGELDEQIIEQIKRAQMSARHDHLNELLK